MLLRAHLIGTAADAVTALLRAHGPAASALPARSICGTSSSCSDASLHGGPAAPGDQGPWVTHLASRAVICMEGKELLQFLQGMVTNDMRPLAAPGAGPVYAALVTPKGKLLHDMFHGGAAGGPGRLWLDVDTAGAEAVLRWLSRYKLRRPIAIEAAGVELAVWARYGGGGKDASAAAAAAAAGGSGWRADPRLPGQLGERGVFAAGGGSGGPAGGGGWRVAGEASHRALRYGLGVAEGAAEMTPERFTPLEFNLDALAGVSYSKGCYIGQERNSYTHFRGIIRRRLMPVTLERPGLAPGTEVVAAGGGSAGMLLASEGHLGLAHLKLGPALAAAAAAGCGGGAALHAAGDAAAGVRPVRPAWWPREWGHEEEAPAAPKA
ncbi:MAG: hypothetical protein J3K34DRAFT_455826 [Monoraphidium minutum]|nr:MAG: hypothetical protein J3K34DRAFT_455826 [Monoraphidium minutum]